MDDSQRRLISRVNKTMGPPDGVKETCSLTDPHTGWGRRYSRARARPERTRVHESSGERIYDDRSGVLGLRPSNDGIGDVRRRHGLVVLKTAVHAIDQDLEVTVLSDLCVDADQARHDACMDAVLPTLARVMPSDEWLATLGPVPTGPEKPPPARCRASSNRRRYRRVGALSTPSPQRRGQIRELKVVLLLAPLRRLAATGRSSASAPTSPPLEHLADAGVGLRPTAFIRVAQGILVTRLVRINRTPGPH